jgi:hypothetical protein
MKVPGYAYFIALAVTLIAGVIAFFSLLDPEGRGRVRFCIAAVVACLAIVALFVLGLVDLA